MTDAIDSRIPNAFTTWQLWHSDMFDRDSPPSLQASGTNVIQGLYELWFHTLKEGLLDNGSASFSRFQLTWGNRASIRVDIAVRPFNNRSLLKLRQWATLMTHNQNSEEKQSDVILLRLAQLHYEFLQKRSRWKSLVIDWSAESRELLARVEVMEDSK